MKKFIAIPNHQVKGKDVVFKADADEMLLQLQTALSLLQRAEKQFAFETFEGEGEEVEMQMQGMENSIAKIAAPVRVFIEKGIKYKCIKPVVMKIGTNKGRAAFIKGHIYEAYKSSNLRNEFGHSFHGISSDFATEHFIQIQAD
tara:strand:+ start:196 stop:627 length:432 start_codon:yes stop_codon:yes gene_type:complete